MVYVILSSLSFISSATNSSVSRLAVPLPIATAVMPHFFMDSRNILLLPSISSCGLVGCITPQSRSLPVSSTTANLQPVLYAGSIPIITLPFTLGVRSRLFRFFAKTSMAFSSASSLKVERRSSSADTLIVFFRAV